MRFTVNGDQFDLDVETVTGRLRGRAPDPIQTHWVEVNGVRFPVKQALEVVLGISRSTFTSQVARLQFDRLGFPTSSGTRSQPPPAPQSTAGSALPHATVEQAGAAFLRGGLLSAGIGAVEHDLLNADRTTATRVTAAAGLTEHLLRAALIVRRDVGRVSDVIHATVISLALPAILEDGEVVSNRPSLGPGNDQSRPFDLETNRRVAESRSGPVGT
jgi:hypothetical protein